MAVVRHVCVWGECVHGYVRIKHIAPVLSDLNVFNLTRNEVAVASAHSGGQ